MDKTLLVEGMYGLGDNVYQLPIVAKLTQDNLVYLRTPWPQLYINDHTNLDNIFFVKPATKLRTQRKNIERLNEPDEGFWHQCNAHHHVIHLNYVSRQKKGIPLYKGLTQAAGLGIAPAFNYHLQLRPACKDRKDYAVIRPCTLREEWKAPSRNPRPQYVQQCIDYLEKQGIQTIVLADIDPPHEVYEGPRPRASRYYEAGEFDVSEMLDLVHRARLCVGPVGFLAPLCIALGTPAVILHGGAGGWNHPKMIDAPGEGKLTHVLPANYCSCKSHEHACDKETDPQIITAAIDSVL